MLNISPINNNTNTNFKSLKVATTRTFTHNSPIDIDLYRLRKEDQMFIETLPQKIDFKKLFPKIDSKFLQRWEEVFNYTLNKAELRENISYAAVHDGKICGMITYHNDIPPLYLDGICTIPVKKNKKVPFSGQTLMYQLFRDASFLKSKEIFLDAITDGPFDVVKLYERLGFRKDYSDRNFGYVPMSCTAQKIQEQLKNFSKYIEYNDVKLEKINLMEFLD